MEEQPKPAEPPAPQPSPPPSSGSAKPVITYDDFERLDLRIATVLAVRAHPNADKLVVMDIDLGGGQQRQIIAGLKPYMPMESLAGKTIVVLTNLQPRKMRGLESNGMLLAASFDENQQRKVVVLTTDGAVPPGSPVS